MPERRKVYSTREFLLTISPDGVPNASFAVWVKDMLDDEVLSIGEGNLVPVRMYEGQVVETGLDQDSLPSLEAVLGQATLDMAIAMDSAIAEAKARAAELEEVESQLADAKVAVDALTAKLTGARLSDPARFCEPKHG
ncbi:hypothetical protein BH10PSE7_BH10PSE7_15580 [soil metagenome]